EEKAREEKAAADLSARATKEKEKDKPAEGARAGTLTLSTSVEVNVEVDGKSVGTSPAVIAVRKREGKIKLYGPSIQIAVTLAYKVEDSGISVKLDANPWAIAKHN